MITPYVIYLTHYSEIAQDDNVREIYAKIIRATGQSQDALPLHIVEEDTINAYTDGEQVVIYRGLLNTMTSDDEIAMVLGHEVAHDMLFHLHMLNMGSTNDEISVLEANADKMGAFYMMKAGYDVCKGRLLFKEWKEKNGNYLGQNHPDYSYRFDELNVNCD